ncbi:MAG: transporter ATP-binding protein [Alphaproteobacteria bacterium]|nr:transporter ATP-binding protein [Alphaproteobacteria bacterium]
MLPDRVLSFDRLLGSALLAVALLAVLILADSYLLRLLAIAGCYAILAIGYQRIFGELGVLSLAQGAFFAIGGYVTAILGLRWQLDGLMLLSAAIAAAALVSVLVAPPMLKLASHYFALASLAVAQLVLLAAVNLEELTGGANGLSSLAPVQIAGFAIDQGKPLTLAIWLLAACCAVAFWLPGPLALLRRHVLREAPLVGEAIGLGTVRWRISAFAFSAACAGLAGGLYVQATGVVAPDIAELAVMINVLAMSVIGGRGRVSGALIGAVLLAFLPEALRFLGGWQLFAWGAAMLLMLLLAPGGIAGLLESLLARRETPVPTVQSSEPRDNGGTLQIEGLSKRFGGVIALADVSLAIGEREIVGIIGPNGAGKTTLLNLLSGFQQADSGTMMWRGVDLAGQPAHRRAPLGIGRSFQTDQLPGDVTVMDAIAAASPERFRLDAARRQAMGAVQRLGLTEFAATALQDLSPATRRLVDLARALAAAPSLLLLDEPTSGLSAAERDTLLRVLRQLREDGLSLLLIEHDVGFLLALADRLLCLDQGRVIAQGPPQDLAARTGLRRFFGRWAVS